MKIDPYYQRRRCRPMTLDSGSIRFMHIFTGVHWRGGVKWQWGTVGLIENVFSGLSDTSIRLRHLRKWDQHYYIILFNLLSPFHWPQNTWPWMILNGLNGHFTLNFHYYELTLRVLFAGFECIIYLFTVESVYVRVMSGDVGSGVADRDQQNIWNPRKNCGSFVDATSSEP